MAEASALAVATPNFFQTANPATGEKGPEFGIREFCNIKTVLIEEL
jgi:hypothetical protein